MSRRRCDVAAISQGGHRNRPGEAADKGKPDGAAERRIGAYGQRGRSAGATIDESRGKPAGEGGGDGGGKKQIEKGRNN